MEILHLLIQMLLLEVEQAAQLVMIAETTGVPVVELVLYLDLLETELLVKEMMVVMVIQG